MINSHLFAMGAKKKKIVEEEEKEEVITSSKCNAAARDLGQLTIAK